MQFPNAGIQWNACVLNNGREVLYIAVIILYCNANTEYKILSNPHFRGKPEQACHLAPKVTLSSHSITSTTKWIRITCTKHRKMLLVDH